MERPRIILTVVPAETPVPLPLALMASMETSSAAPEIILLAASMPIPPLLLTILFEMVKKVEPPDERSVATSIPLKEFAVVIT